MNIILIKLYLKMSYTSKLICFSYNCILIESRASLKEVDSHDMSC